MRAERWQRIYKLILYYAFSSNGKTALIYVSSITSTLHVTERAKILLEIVDGFAQQWVKTPGSIDLTVAAVST